MSAQTIYNQLCLGGMSPVGACAMLGNMMAESALRSNNAQDGMTSLSDEAYTLAADRGTISFATDAVGYGLCQWTYWSRKQGLLNFAKQRGKSVGDEQTQVYYCLRELQDDFSALWQYLRKATDIDEATDRICTEFERPAVNNFMTRRDHAKRYYNELVSGAMSFETAVDTVYNSAPVEQSAISDQLKRIAETIIQNGLVLLGYSADSGRDRAYDMAVYEYAKDIEEGKWG